MGSKQITGVQVPALPIVGLTTFNSASSFIIAPTHYCDWAVMGSERTNVCGYPKHDINVSWITTCPSMFVTSVNIRSDYR